MMICISIFSPSLLLVLCVARIGAHMVVFGLVTPLDHPPETTQWVTAWVGGLYILYIYRAVLWVVGWVVEWGHETKNNPICPDPRDKSPKKMRA